MMLKKGVLKSIILVRLVLNLIRLVLKAFGRVKQIMFNYEFLLFFS